ncbi:hypothetical protein E4T63_26430 [Pseudomonas fluorescens]|uniref:Uncharacterized protein n=1 Tax=Pseudomonas fluorescens TaxID=294 RepID=A0AAP9CL10_PSEFL|nr:hypothetical protein E3Z29_00290 [Pseudomonas sp. S150]QBX43933.1 hypothetical protein E4T63_26430 [Pseudomonas fluorescens]
MCCRKNRLANRCAWFSAESTDPESAQAVLTPSRASPLPHWNAFECGSGLAREEASESNTSLS